MAKSLFITFEGGEGAGKSTQVARLAGRFAETGRDVVTTREPGGSAGAEKIRELLVRGDSDRWSPITETLLIYAARRDHIERVIRPALDRGAMVICDRFIDSTRAYQGAGGGVSHILIQALESHTLAGSWPDLTLILDLPVEVGLARAAGRGGAEARFESKALEFHQRLRDAFIAIARHEPNRCVTIDASADEESVAARVWAAVSRRLGAS